MTKGERFIHFHSHLEYGVLTLTMDNSFDGRVKEKNGTYYSSKRDGEGLGLSSVASVAKKHGGSARFETEDTVFRASVYMRVRHGANKGTDLLFDATDGLAGESPSLLSALGKLT